MPTLSSAPCVEGPSMTGFIYSTDFPSQICPQRTIEQVCRPARNPLGSSNDGMVTIGAGVAGVLADAGASPVFFNEC